jgi:hypothetical protein
MINKVEKQLEKISFLWYIVDTNEGVVSILCM